LAAWPAADSTRSPTSDAGFEEEEDEDEDEDDDWEGCGGWPMRNWGTTTVGMAGSVNPVGAGGA
jgi:hypothetical protein